MVGVCHVRSQIKLECELLLEITATKSSCSIERRQSQYEISYQPTIKGRHQLHIRVEGQHIRGSPFSVAAHFPTPLAREQFKYPRGIYSLRRCMSFCQKERFHCTVDTKACNAPFDSNDPYTCSTITLKKMATQCTTPLHLRVARPDTSQRVYPCTRGGVKGLSFVNSDMSHILAMGAGLATATGAELWGVGLAVHGAA